MPEKRTRTLGQVAGVMMHIRTQDGEAGKVIQKKIQSEALTTGMTKIFTPKSETADEHESAMLKARHPDRYKAVALTVETALAEAAGYAIPALDITATADKTNQLASANVIINGEVLIPDVPVSHLLWLGNTYLGELKKFIALLPVLDPTKEWHPADGGIHESTPEVIAANDKDLVPVVLHEGTDRHPPQVQLVQKDQVYVGKYTSKSLSGAVFESRKKELLDRMDQLIAAVKDAAARANQTPATEVTEGEDIFRFLLA
jgi:hypothetical protein